MKDKKLHLRILARDNLVYKGEVSSVTSTNERGKFDVLPEHAHFISLVTDYVLIRELDGREHELKVTQGIIRVRDDYVNIYI